MSGLEVLGLVFGGIPFAITALKSVHNLAAGARRWKKYRDILEVLEFDLRIQQVLLKETLAALGLNELDSGTTNSELELWIYKNFDRPRGEVILGLLQRMRARIFELHRCLEIDLGTQPKWTEPAWNERAKYEWRRMLRSFDRDKQREFIKLLEDDNRNLSKLTGTREILSPMDGSDVITKIQSTYDAKQCNSLRKQLSSIHTIVSDRCSCTQENKTHLHLAWPTKTKSSTLDVDFILPLVTNGTERDAIYQAQQTNIWQSATADVVSERTVEQAEEASCLCTAVNRLNAESNRSMLLKHPDNAVPTQLRISPAPENKQGKVKEFNFASLFDNNSRHTLGLSERTRYQVAALMAWMILHLEGSPWLHSMWSRRDWTLLSRPGESGQWLAHKPYLSRTLKHGSFVAAEDNGDHEDQWQELRPIWPNRTLYILGILLIELCLDRPFQQIREEHGVQSPTREQILEDLHLVKARIPDVYQRAGDAYGYAVERCIMANFPLPPNVRDFEFESFRKSFFDGVVAPVQARFEMTPFTTEVF